MALILLAALTLQDSSVVFGKIGSGRGAAQNQKSVHDQYTLDILAVHKNQYNQYIKNSNVLINQYTKNLNFSTWKDYFQYNKKT